MNLAGVLARIPGWETATVAPLDGGTTNSTWLVDSGECRAVLKVDAEPRCAPFNTRGEEARIQRTAAVAGLANAVIYASETVLLTEYVEGEVWTAETFGDAGKLVALARTLREVHALPLTGRVFDGPGAAGDYARNIAGVAASAVREKLDIVEQAPRLRRLALCHNDLVAENILSAPAVRLLDWEYACDNDPFFDLATVVAHHGLSEPEANRFLDAYCGSADDEDREHLFAYCRVYRALLWLWQEANRMACRGLQER